MNTAIFSDDDDNDCVPSTCNATVTSESSVQDVINFLKLNGIPEKFCQVFNDNYIDGNEFIGLTESEVKSLVPPMGLAKKVLRLIPSKNIPSGSESSVSLSTPTHNTSVTCSPSVEIDDSFDAVSPPPVRPASLPDQWRPHVEDCIAMKKLDDSARNEIVRSTVQVLFTKYKKPSRTSCDDFARKLILKYPFMKDDLGNGYQSWSDKIVERIRNVIKRDRKRATQQIDEPLTPKTKRSKKSSSLVGRYPINVPSAISTSQDSSSIDELKNAIKTELSKGKPRDLVLAPLMKSTFEERRMHILSVITSVNEFLDEYPALSRPAMIEQEMGLVLGKPEVKSFFLKQWSTKYVPAILEYASSSAKKSISSIVSSIQQEDNVSRSVIALRILSESLDRKDSIVYLYEEYNESDGAMDMICKKLPLRNQPRIASYNLASSPRKQYFIICEQAVLCEVADFEQALFVTFSCYYCFNLDYPIKAKNVLSFLQDFILEHPEATKKPASYLAIVSDIKRNL